LTTLNLTANKPRIHSPNKLKKKREALLNRCQHSLGTNKNNTLAKLPQIQQMDTEFNFVPYAYIFFTLRL